MPEIHPTLDLIAERHRTGSKPLHRTDDARLAVVLEGGSSRAAYGGGMVCALEERGLLHTFDAVYGTSAGALNGAWLVCERACANIHGWWSPESMRASINPRRALRGRPIVDTDIIVNTLYETVTPMGFDEILASDVEYHPIATDVVDGKSTDLAPLITDKLTLKLAMRASASMPVLGGPPISLGGHHFIDGGISESIPVEQALRQGATHVLVLRTKSPEVVATPDRAFERQLVARWMARHAPGAAIAWGNRANRKTELEELLASDQRVMQVSPPPGAPRISVVGRSQDLQREAVERGATIMRETLSQAL